MYQIKQQESYLSLIKNNQLLVSEILPMVTLQREGVLALQIKESKEVTSSDSRGSYITRQFEYTDEQELVQLSLTFRCYNELLFIYIKFQCKSDFFETHRSISSEAGIRLQCNNMENLEALMGNYSFTKWWTRPYFGEVGQLPENTQSFLWKDEETYHYLLPVTSAEFKSTLTGNGTGFDILTTAYSGGYSEGETLVAIIGSGQDPFALAEETIYAGLDAHHTTGLTREQRAYPEILEYLGWCTWDAFYKDVNEEEVLKKAAEFRAEQLPIKWVMIDDGWSVTTPDRRLSSFDADENKFPQGLAHTVQVLKEEYDVDWVGVWHTFFGYWDGIDSKSELASTYQEHLYRTLNNQLIPHPDGAKGFGFWNAFHAHLKKQGIDFVKVDSQSSLIHFVNQHIPIAKAAKGLHDALEASVGIHFNQAIINCMGMSAENIWNRASSAVSRNSDDFFPNREQSFKEHALQNAYNSFYHAHFMWGDWDMWWTEHADNVNNAILRAVSGGPIYISDKVGETDPAQIWPLVYSDGRIIRCDQPGLPTEDCLLRNPNEEAIPLKVWNRVGQSAIIAAFNIHVAGQQVEGAVSPSDIPDVTGEAFLIYEHFSRQTQIVRYEEKINFQLADQERALFTILPYDQELTLIGLVNKYISPAAIEHVYTYGSHTKLQLYEGGKFAFMSKKEPKKALVNGQEVAIQQENNLYIVDCRDRKEKVLLEIF